MTGTLKEPVIKNSSNLKMNIEFRFKIVMMEILIGHVKYEMMLLE